MIKLILKFIILISLAVGTCYSILRLDPKYNSSYIAGIKPKLKKLEQIKTKKIVIIGGSSTSFGIDSDFIENKLKIPVVNMGLHGNLGAEFWLESVKGNLRKGDILILSSEYYRLYKNNWYGMEGNSVATALLYTPKKIPIIFKDYDLFKTWLHGILRMTKAYWHIYPKFQPLLEENYGVYDIRSFKNDNIKAGLNDMFNGTFSKIDLVFDKDKFSIEKMQDYAAYFNDRGVEFFITPPSVMNEFINEQQSVNYYDSINKYTNIPVLNKYSNYVFERKYFFDTFYHLNTKGRKMRSELLVKEIRDQVLYERNQINDQEIRLSDNANSIALKEMNDPDNVRLEYTDKSNLLIQPVNSDKQGYIRYKYKTNHANDYFLNKTLKITVTSKPEIANNLELKTVRNYLFDYINNVKGNTFTLYKELSNVDIDYKDGFSYLGIGFGYLTPKLSSSDTFNISSIELLENFGVPSEFIKNVKYYEIPSGTEKIIFEIMSQTKDAISLNKITTINSSFQLKINNKYMLKQLEDQTIILQDFYSGNKLFQTLQKEEVSFFTIKGYAIKLSL